MIFAKLSSSCGDVDASGTADNVLAAAHKPERDATNKMAEVD